MLKPPPPVSHPYLCRWLIAALLLCAAFAAQAAPVVRVDADTDLLSIEPMMEIRRAAEGEFNPASLIDKASGWQPLGRSFRIGRTRDVIWLRVQLVNADSEDLDLRLQLGNPSLGEVGVWSQGESFHFAGLAGARQPFAARPVRHHDLVFPIHLLAYEARTVLLRVRYDGVISAPITVSSRDRFEDAALTGYLLKGTYLGLVLVMAIYNLALFLGTRQSVYLIYVVYVLLTGLFIAAWNGLAFQYLWPRSIAIEDAAVSATVMGVVASGLLFVRAYLVFPRHADVWRRSMLLLAVYAVAVGVGGLLFGNHVAVYWGEQFALASAVLLIFSAALHAVFGRDIHGATPGRRSALYFLVASAAMLIGGALGILRNLGVLAHGPLTVYGIQIGAAVEILILSLGLAERIAELRAEAHQMRKLAMTDSLTGIVNRQGFDDRVHALLRQAREQGRPVAVLMFDLDGFKEANDRYGHQVGDEILRIFARRLEGSCMPDDLVARLGGDEFVVVMAGVAREHGGEARVARLLARIDGPIRLSGHVLPCAASCGVAWFPEDAQGLTELLACADRRMYADKAARQVMRAAPSGTGLPLQ